MRFGAAGLIVVEGENFTCGEFELDESGKGIEGRHVCKRPSSKRLSPWHMEQSHSI